MRPDRSSITAENNAVLRAHETMRPAQERILSDPYAAYFLPSGILAAANRDDRIRQAVADWDVRYPGVGNSIIARTRFVDDCLEAAVAAGIRQVVILGAGYDTRAMRCKGMKAGVAVFELDYPATQRTKLARLNRRFDAERHHVRYIPIDFVSEPLDEKLIAHGYDAHAASLFIWEGVTYYISAAIVDRTLDFIRRQAAAGSSVVFDFFPSAVAEGTTHLPEARALRDGLRHIGEAIVFGIPPHRIHEYLMDRGFGGTRCLSSADFRKCYFYGVNRSRTVSGMFFFVQAWVP